MLDLLGGASSEASALSSTGALWARLPRELIVCALPEATSAAAAAALASPLVPQTPTTPAAAAAAVASPAGRLHLVRDQAEWGSLCEAAARVPAHTLCALLACAAADWSVEQHEP